MEGLTGIETGSLIKRGRDVTEAPGLTQIALLHDRECSAAPKSQREAFATPVEAEPRKPWKRPTPSVPDDR